MSLPSFQRRTLSLLRDLQTRRARYCSLADSGTPLANTVVNARLQEGYVEHPSYWIPGIPPAGEDVGEPEDDEEDALSFRDRYASFWCDRTTSLVCDVRVVLEKMTAQVDKMKLLCDQFSTLLEDFCAAYGGAETAAKTPVSKTLSLHAHVEQARRFYTLHRNDLELKGLILQALPILPSSDRQGAILYLSAWIHNTEIDLAWVEEWKEMIEVEFGDTERKSNVPHKSF